MTLISLFIQFQALSTPHLADACSRLGLPVRRAPSALNSLLPTFCPHLRDIGRAVEE